MVQSAAEEAALLAEEQARIDDNGELEMENEGNNGDHDDNDSDDGEEIDDNPIQNHTFHFLGCNNMTQKLLKRLIHAPKSYSRISICIAPPLRNNGPLN